MIYEIFGKYGCSRSCGSGEGVRQIYRNLVRSRYGKGFGAGYGVADGYTAYGGGAANGNQEGSSLPKIERHWVLG